jgi:hypothetical protein
MKKVFTLLTMMAAFALTSQAAYYLVGNEPFGNGWDPSNGVEMTKNADGTYSFTATVNGSIWFVFADALAESGDWATFNNTMRIGPTGGDEEVTAGTWTTFQKSEGDHGAYKFTGSGSEYTITLNPYSKKFKIDGYVEPIVIDTYTVAGTPASVFGTEWDATNTDNDMVKLDNGMYQLDKYNCALGAGSELQFKVVGNHDWGNAWPAENRTVTLDQSGVYNLRFTFDPTTTFCGVQASLIGTIDTRTGDLFILGEVNDNDWAANVGLQMATEDQNIFTANFTTKGATIDENDGIGYSYFSFTTKLAEDEDWSTIQAYRLGANEENFLLSDDMMGVELPLGANTNSYKIPAGEYQATVNLDAMTVVITKVVKETTATPVISYETTDDEVIITVTGEGEVHVYVDGVEVENPYIIPRGEEDVTVVVTATAQEDGKEISETATETIVVPAKPAPEQTEMPVISYETTDDAVIITVTGEGEVHVYVDGVEVENPYTIARGTEDVTVVVTATAQGEGKLISETATAEIVVPAKVGGGDEDGYKIEPLWVIDDLSFLTAADMRQGFGMNGKFYINNKADQKVLVVDENGLANTEFEGGANCGITRDEAGNIVVSNAKFPDAWSEATIKVINPETGDVKEYTVPAECGIEGRCDFIGFAKGNLMEDGVIYLTGAANSGISILTIAGGEVNADECYVAPCDGLSPTSSTVINYYTDLEGEESLLYVTRNAALVKIGFDGEELVPATMTLPNKGACNGTFAFVWDNKEFFVYPTLANYLNGFAVAEANAEAPIVEVPATAAANGNNFQANWLNAEVVNKNEVLIYQYYPGDVYGMIAVYRLTKVGGGIEELVNDTEKVVANVRYFNIMGQEMKEANGLTIVVTTYTDGSSNAVKVMK